MSYTKRIQIVLKNEGIDVSLLDIRKILNSFLGKTVRALIEHKIVDWKYFRFDYDLKRLRRSIEFNPTRYKTKFFEKKNQGASRK